MSKLLYIDLPFAGERGGDKNRSKFIWKALTDSYQVDLLLINHWKNDDFKYNLPDKCKLFFEIATSKPGISFPESIFNFSIDQLEKFRNILIQHTYDIVFIRFASPSLLASEVSKILPNAKVIIDIDMVFSRLSELSWKTNPTLKNRFFFIENKKLVKFERKLFNLPYLFLFTNYIEKKIVEKKYVKPASKGILKILPNVMHANGYPLPENKKNYLLFFGALNSAANKDAFEFISKDIYPLIAQKLKDKNIKLRIVGKNQLPMYQKIVDDGNLEMIDLIGEVDDIYKEIADSLFVILPIRIASGTRTRILEAANLRTAVISNTIGAEGFTFEPDEIIIRDDPKELANEIIALIDNPEKCLKFGEKLLKKSHDLYLDDIVALNLVKEIKEYRR